MTNSTEAEIYASESGSDSELDAQAFERATASLPPRALRIFLNLVALSIVAVGSIPLARTINWLFTTGGNCIGNDYVGWIRFIDKFMSGGFDWLEFARGAFQGTHYCFASLLLELWLCKLSLWNVNLECMVGITLSLIATLFLWGALSEPQAGRWNYVLLAALLAVNFGSTQSSVLLHSMFSLRQPGLSQLGFSVGVFSLVKVYPKHPLVALALLGTGGVIASYTCGAALPVWTGLFSLLVMLGYRRRRDILLFALSCLTGMLPYAYQFVFLRRPLGGTNEHLGAGSILDLLGRPLCNNIGWNFGPMPEAQAAAAFGLAGLAAMLFFAHRLRWRSASLKAALALVIFSLSAACLLIQVRGMIAPWYCAMMKFFWMGFVAVAISLFRLSLKECSTAKRQWPALALSGLVLLTWVVLFKSTNMKYEDKQFYLSACAPASESIQRHYETAPTYVEWLLFQWGPGNQKHSRLLGSVLRKNSLLCFGADQEWTLQGDSIRHNVIFNESPDCPAPKWIIGHDLNQARPCTDYHHLNLSIEAPQRVIWKVRLPDNLVRARFHSRCFLADKAKGDTARGAICDVRVAGTESSPESRANHAVFHRLCKADSHSLPIDVPLEHLAGQTVTISIANQPEPAHTAAALVFEYPRIDLTLSPVELARMRQKPELIQPENTDISPVFPALTKDDFVWPVEPARAVHLDGKDLLLRQYSHLYIRACGLGPEKPQLVARLKIEQSGQPGQIDLNIPMLLDSKTHGYTYDFKTNLPAPDTRLKSIDLSFAGSNLFDHQNSTIYSARLLKDFACKD